MEDFIPTRVSQLKKNATSNFVSVQYEAPKKKQKADASKISEEKKEDAPRLKRKQEIVMDAKKQQELEMKRVRYEVMKFGMSGFEKAKAKKAKVALALSLGAKGGKKRKMNYKKLQIVRSVEKRREKKQEQVSGLNKSLVKHKVTGNKKKSSDSILGVYGKVEGAGSKKNRR